MNRRGATGMHTHGYPLPYSTLAHPSAAAKPKAPARPAPDEPVLQGESSSQAG